MRLRQSRYMKMNCFGCHLFQPCPSLADPRENLRLLLCRTELLRFKKLVFFSWDPANQPHPLLSIILHPPDKMNVSCHRFLFVILEIWGKNLSTTLFFIAFLLKFSFSWKLKWCDVMCGPPKVKCSRCSTSFYCRWVSIWGNISMTWNCVLVILMSSNLLTVGSKRHCLQYL